MLQQQQRAATKISCALVMLWYDRILAMMLQPDVAAASLDSLLDAEELYVYLRICFSGDRCSILC
jgi:hypothetical protein